MTYKLSEAAAAVGISSAKLATWCDRGMVPTPKVGKGTNRTFSIKDIDRAAIVYELTRTGLPVAEASRAASVFSDQRSTGRPRGQLHPDDAKTLLVVTKDGASVHRAYDRQEFESAMAMLFADTHGCVVLNIGEVTRRVDVALNGDTTPKPPAATIFREGRALTVLHSQVAANP